MGVWDIYGTFMGHIWDTFETLVWSTEQAEKYKANPVEAIGRYAADPKPNLIVTDAGKEYRIRFENEVIEKAKQW
jgi:hypothetical protein